jgi:hypothetical protein
MTSSGEPARRGSFVWKAVAVGVVVVIVAVSVFAWQRYGTHNVFDAIMVDEWQEATTEWANPTPDWPLASKYERVLDKDNDTRYPQELRYYALDDGTDPEDNMDIDIKPAFNPNKCDLDGCAKSKWDSKHPVTLTFETTVWGYDSTDYTCVAVVIDYDKRTRHLTEHVAAYDHDDEVTDGIALATMLAQNGITNQYLQQRRDWLLYDQFLPDFLGAYPSIRYTASDWGDVTVSTDSFLS